MQVSKDFSARQPSWRLRRRLTYQLFKECVLRQSHSGKLAQSVELRDALASVAIDMKQAKSWPRDLLGRLPKDGRTFEGWNDATKSTQPALLQRLDWLFALIDDGRQGLPFGDRAATSRYLASVIRAQSRYVALPSLLGALERHLDALDIAGDRSGPDWVERAERNLLRAQKQLTSLIQVWRSDLRDAWWRVGWDRGDPVDAFLFDLGCEFTARGIGDNARGRCADTFVAEMDAGLALDPWAIITAMTYFLGLNLHSGCLADSSRRAIWALDLMTVALCVKQLQFTPNGADLQVHWKRGVGKDECLVVLDACLRSEFDWGQVQRPVADCPEFVSMEWNHMRATMEVAWRSYKDALAPYGVSPSDVRAIVELSEPEGLRRKPVDGTKVVQLMMKML